MKLLNTNQHIRPSCEKILNFSIFNDLKILLGEKTDNNQFFSNENEY